MGTLALPMLFALASAFAWTGFDLFRKLLVRRLDSASLVVWLNALSAPWALAGVAVSGQWALGTGYWPPALASVVLNVLANFLFLESVRLGRLSTSIPLLSLTPVFTALLAFPMLAELPRPVQSAGIALVVIGALLLEPPQPSRFKLAGPLLGFIASRSNRYMVGVALLWSLTPVFDKLALRHASAFLHTFVLTAGTGIGMALWLAARRRGGPISPKANLGLVVVASVTSVVAVVFQLVAIKLLLVSHFEALKRGISMTGSVLNGRVFFGESIRTRTLVSVALMLSGVVVLSF
ncbi:MAG TPA: DMT family transporter [Polyangiaceae bacterium]|jgi:uncharacterized membrane protein